MIRIGTTLLCALLLSLAHTQSDIRISAIVSKNNLNWTEAVGALLLADALGLDLDLIISARRSYGTSVYDLAPVFIVHRQSRQPVHSILVERKKGLGWGAIAKRFGVHPGAFNRARRSFDGVSDVVIVNEAWTPIIVGAYGVPVQQVAVWRSSLPWRDIVPGVHIARSSSRSPNIVFADWKSDKNWDRVRAKHKSSDRWMSKKGKFGKPPGLSSSNKGSANKAKGKGKGKR